MDGISMLEKSLKVMSKEACCEVKLLSNCNTECRKGTYHHRLQSRQNSSEVVLPRRYLSRLNHEDLCLTKLRRSECIFKTTNKPQVSGGISRAVYGNLSPRTSRVRTSAVGTPSVEITTARRIINSNISMMRRLSN